MAGGKGGSSSQITGYKYTMAVQFGIGRGPVNELTDIRIGDIPAWQGVMTATSVFTLNQPNLFGGDQKEGGIVGTVWLYMGDQDQTIDPLIVNNIQGGFPVPSWRGVTTLMYYGQISANNPYPKAWKFRVNRATAGWDGPVFVPEAAVISLQSTPQTIIAFNSLPNDGDSVNVGDVEVFFLKSISSGPPTNVEIGSDLESTATNFSNMINAQSVHDGTATVSGQIVNLVFPSPITISEGHGSFLTISAQGGLIKAMNPAHIIYECATNGVWGRGLPASMIDFDSFKRCSDRLYDEKFGLCLRWNRQDNIDTFVKLVVDHIGAAVYIDRITGLVSMKLIRDDYDPSSLPIYTFENGIIDIQEDESSSSDTSFNEIIVKYNDPVAHAQGSLRLQNLASFQSLGTVISTTTEYLGLPTADLAARVAQRDLQINSGDVRRFKIKFDRVGYSINPADVFKISAPSRGINELILRAGGIEEGPLDDETITITAMQDVFGLPTSSFVVPQQTFWSPPTRGARVISDRYVGELTYLDLAGNLPSGQLSAMTADTGVVKIFAEAPSGPTVDYILADKTSLETDYAEKTVAGFDAVTKLTTGIDLHDTDIEFGPISNAGLIEAINIPVLLQSGDVEEYCVLQAIDIDAGTAVLGRGAVDTIPHKFSAGTKLWFQTHMPTTDLVDRSTGEELDVKLLSRTTSDKLSLTLASTDVVTIGGRQGRPYPPGNMQIGGSPYLDTQLIVGDVVFTWAHRDRVTQGNFMIDTTAGSTGPETGTTYNIRVYDGEGDPETDAPIRTVSALTGTTWIYDLTMDAADGALSSYYFVIESERDGLVSWQHYKIRVTRFEGFDTDFDSNFDGG